MLVRPRIRQSTSQFLYEIQDTMSDPLKIASANDGKQDTDPQLVLEAWTRYPIEMTEYARELLNQNDCKNQSDESNSAHEIWRSTGEAPDTLARDTNPSTPNSDSPPKPWHIINGVEMFDDFLILDWSPALQKLIDESPEGDIEIDARNILITLPLLEMLAERVQSLSNDLPRQTEPFFDTQLLSDEEFAATGDETAT